MEVRDQHRLNAVDVPLRELEREGVGVTELSGLRKGHPIKVHIAGILYKKSQWHSEKLPNVSICDTDGLRQMHFQKCVNMNDRPLSYADQGVLEKKAVGGSVTSAASLASAEALQNPETPTIEE